MERGEVWRTELDGSQPVVLIGVDGPPGETLQAIQIVAPATAEQRCGFTFLDPDFLPDEWIASSGESGITGVELPIGPDEGLEPVGVVRLAMPHEGRIFCTWQVGLAAEHLTERLGVLSPPALRRLDHALRLAGMTRV